MHPDRRRVGVQLSVEKSPKDVDLEEFGTRRARGGGQEEAIDVSGRPGLVERVDVFLYLPVATYIQARLEFDVRPYVAGMAVAIFDFKLQVMPSTI